MMNELVVGGIGLLTTIVSGWTSWFFTRRKYYGEVDHTLIENMESSLEFYKKLSDDNRERLDSMARRNEEMATEIQELRKQVLDLTVNICMDMACARRLREHVVINKGTNGKSKSRLDETEDIG